MKRTGAQINATNLENTTCPLCQGDNPENVYNSSQECGPLLGNVPINLSMCQLCGFLYLNPRPATETIRKYYEQESSTSGNTFYLTDPGSRFDKFNRRRKSFFTTHWMKTVSTAQARILDIGCGAGHFLASLLSDGYQLYGLEPSEKACSKALSKGLNVANTGIESNPFEDNFFDVIFCHSVLEHIHDLNTTLLSISRILKQDGFLFIELPDSTRPDPGVGEFFSFEHISHFTPGTLSQLLVMHGFQVIAITADEDSPRLRACATISEEIQGLPVMQDDRDKMKNALIHYRDQQEILRNGIAKRLDKMIGEWKRNNLRVGIYGAGIHTQNLLSMSRLGEVLSAVLDSDISKSGSVFLSWIVQPPSQIDTLGLNVIVISSKAFQDEIWAQLLPLQSCYGFDMVKLYE
jgi:SAM-dependent methyltransferase